MSKIKEPVASSKLCAFCHSGEKVIIQRPGRPDICSDCLIKESV